MKVTVGDVTNNKVDIRDYMSVDDETGRIIVHGEELYTVLIDKSEEWNELQEENIRLRKALEKAKRELSDDESIIDCARNAYYTVSQALKE